MMKVAVAGGTGFVGSHLVRKLIARGDDVMIISRGKQTSADAAQTPVVTWQALEEQPDLMEGVDAIVQLSGSSINQRWNAKGKHAILQSRLDTTNAIARLVDKLATKPRVVVNGSGMTIYGTSDVNEYDERSPTVVDDYLSSVVQRWEAAADQIKGTRVVKLRVGLVLGKNEGALPLMLLPYRLWVGGRVGSGKQWVSWIHIEDIVRLILHCIDNPEVVGSVNATAPHPVVNDEFGKIAGKVLGRPHYFPVPAFMMRLALGELSDLMLKGQKVLPHKALNTGFTFEYGTLEQALEHLVGRKQT